MEDRLNIDQFFDDLLNNTDEKIFSNIYIDENIMFFKKVNAFLYNEYLEDRLTLHLAAKILENFMKNMLEEKPSLSNILRDDFGNIEE